jgi:benzoyl-CoA reductase/2-hydroxyglutaryl-CoA dehydratase subunit BcrC/BadD/HgdB
MSKDTWEHWNFDPIDIPNFDKNQKRYSWNDLNDFKKSVEWWFECLKVMELEQVVSVYKQRDEAQERILKKEEAQKEPSHDGDSTRTGTNNS